MVSPGFPGFPNADGHVEFNQVTTYAYSDGNTADCPVRRMDVLVKETYPDSASDCIQYTYFANGARRSKTDQRGVRHEYAFDDAARLTADRVTAVPDPNVDCSVLRIATAYDELGRTATVTSYDSNAVGGGNVLNQVAHSYDANFFGALVATAQSHSGAAGAGTPAVRYVFEIVAGAGGGSAKNMRVQKTVYPNGRAVYYNCPSSGIGAALNRVDNIASSATPAAGDKFAAYSYLGASSIVKLDYPALDSAGGLGLSYDTAGDGSYAAFDKFGRVIDHGWRKTDATAVDRFTYGYDRAGNRTFRKNTVASALGKHLDAKYGYDGLDRLTDANRGDYDVATGQIANRSFAQVWDLSGLGNWRGFNEDTSGDGSWPLTQTRTHNLVNELTGFAQGAGQPAWPAPTYDAAGNMTSGPMGTDPNLRMHMKWDAWNRQTEVRADSAGTPGTPGNLIARYSYDGRTYRIAKAVANGNNWDRTDFYYNDSWQVLEERKCVAQQSAETVATVVYAQYVWDLRYIDSPVCRFRDTDLDGTVDETLYYTSDVNFNVTALVDTSGTVQERYVYSPYGQPTIYNSDWSATIAWASSKKNEILYCGYRYDGETASYYVRHRYYYPLAGRWSQRDPAIPDALSAYVYVDSNPLSRIDPLGLWYLDGDYAVMEKDNTLWGLAELVLGDATQWRRLMRISEDAAKNMQIGTRVNLTKTIDRLRTKIGVYRATLNSIRIAVMNIADTCCKNDKEAKDILEKHAKEQASALEAFKELMEDKHGIVAVNGEHLGAAVFENAVEAIKAGRGALRVAKVGAYGLAIISAGFDVYEGFTAPDPAIRGGNLIMAGVTVGTMAIPGVNVGVALVAVFKSAYEARLQDEIDEAHARLCAESKKVYNDSVKNLTPTLEAEAAGSMEILARLKDPATLRLLGIK